MAEKEATINDAGQEKTEEEASSASEKNFNPKAIGDDIVSTVDFEEADVSPEGEHNTDGDAEGEETGEGEETEEEEAAEVKAEEERKAAEEAAAAQKDKGFHDHPDWKKREEKHKDELSERDRTIESLRQENESLKASVKPEDVETEWSNMSEDDREDLLEDDPTKYHRLAREHDAAVAEKEREVKEFQKRKDDWEKRQDQTFADYAEANPGFTEMWGNGQKGSSKLYDYMIEHPGHNAISAHMMLTKGAADGDKEVVERVRAELAEEHKKDIEAAKKQAVKEYKAKARAGTLIGGDGILPAGDLQDESLQNTNNHGGLVGTLAERLKAKRVNA